MSTIAAVSDRRGSRIVVFGASGYTGRLIAEALIRRGGRPVLAGRSEEKLGAVAEELGGGLELAVADVARPESLAGLVGAGDVLAGAVGPFVRFGEPVVDAAIASGAHYLDIAGEPPFLRRVFGDASDRAAATGVALLPAFGWESVPGNLAGALALEEAGAAAERVDVGYFYHARGGFSGGSQASLAAAGALPGVAFRDGRIRTVRGAERYRRLPAGEERRPAVSVGACEHFSLPQSFPHLVEVNVYIGDFGARSRAVQAASLVGTAIFAVPGVRRVSGSLARGSRSGSTGGPTAEQRAASSTHVVAIAYDRAGEPLVAVHLDGADGYDLTAELAAWGAEQLAAGACAGVGALGPVAAFGLEAVESACAAAGIARSGANGQGSDPLTARSGSAA